MPTIEEPTVRQRLEDVSAEKYTWYEKFKAFLYHTYIVSFGRVLQPEKSKDYIKVFEEFLQYKNSVKS